MTISGLDLLGAIDTGVGFTPGAVRAAALPAPASPVSSLATSSWAPAIEQAATAWQQAEMTREAADLRAGQDLARRLQSGPYDAEVAARTGTPASPPATPGLMPPKQSPGSLDKINDWMVRPAIGPVPGWGVAAAGGAGILGLLLSAIARKSS